ncbi:MAG TPA: HAD family hydrolase [Solirubrobacteraceae bacterium]|nr:HAD family hydrolase [Solirubrobacteraceae bacterium]
MTAERRVDAVLLDALGTLVALQPPASAFVRELQARHTLEVALADAERAFGAEIAYYRAHHQEARDAHALADLRRRCAEVLRAQLPPAARALPLGELTDAMVGALRFAAYPDAHDALALLRARGMTLVVVSNWDVSLPAVLRDIGLAELVDGIVSSAAVGHSKPAPAIFAAGLALAGSTPERTVHVGDSIEHDVRGALGAGIRPVLLNRASTVPGGLPTATPTISSLDELAGLLP